MGNTACSCGSRRHRSEQGSNTPIVKVEAVKCPKTTTPYDNGPDIPLVKEVKFPFDTTENSETIIPHFQNLNQAQNDVPCSPVSFQSNLTSKSDVKRTTSLFSSEDNNLDEESPNIEYDVILREFLIRQYPINDDVIDEMILRNLLLPEDGKILLSLSNNEAKSLSFLNNFVFSEVNICKLATFLHVLVTEKSHILFGFNKTDSFLLSIVDHIYYVINFLSLLVQCNDDEDNLSYGKSITSTININCLKSFEISNRKPSEISDDVFYIKIDMNNATLPFRFWKDFGCINQNFCCCQELVLSSCGLLPTDISNLSQGFKCNGTLRILNLSSNPITDEGLNHLECLFLTKNSLTSLNIACCSISSRGVEDLLTLLSQKNVINKLTSLNLSHNNLRNMTQKHVLLLTTLPLISLEMRSINLSHQRALFESLKLNYSLKRIDISGNKLVSNDVTYLAAGLAYNTRLKGISLAMTGVLKSDCATINNTLLMNKSIVSIDLSDNLIGDDGADILKDILTMKKTLKELFLRRCGISVHGALVLLRKASENECNVKVLDLCYNHSPRMSIVVDVKDIVRKIQDLIQHITLVKDIRILLWGTVDEFPPSNYHGDCLEL